MSEKSESIEKSGKAKTFKIFPSESLDQSSDKFEVFDPEEFT